MNSPTKTKPGRKPLIYIVDDEPLLLDLAEVALRDQGYTLKKFEDPEVALRAFLKARSKPDVLITDFAMGKMSGLDLIEKCRRACPTLRTILVSGTAGAEVVLGAPVPVDRFLSKPYQSANLAELVQRVLGDPPP